MPVTLNVDPKSMGIAKRKLKKYHKQVPFALSQAMNDALFVGREKANKDIVRFTDRPIAHTRRATIVMKTTKRTLKGRVGYSSSGGQDEYLKHLVRGSTNMPKGRAHAAPTRALKLNAAGNVTPGKRAHRLLQNSDKYFSGKPRGRGGPSGVWERYGRGGKKIRPVHIYKASEPHRKQIPFYRNTKRAVKDALPFSFRRRFNAAIASRR